MSDGWWELLLLMYLTGNLEDHTQQILQEAATRSAFEEYAKDCPYLELDNDGRFTERICHHPVRDDSSNWVTCNRWVCPFMVVNASPEEMEEYSAKLTLDNTNAWYNEKLDKEMRDDR